MAINPLIKFGIPVTVVAGVGTAVVLMANKKPEGPKDDQKPQIDPQRSAQEVKGAIPKPSPDPGAGPTDRKSPEPKIDPERSTTRGENATATDPGVRKYPIPAKFQDKMRPTGSPEWWVLLHAACMKVTGKNQQVTGDLGILFQKADIALASDAMDELMGYTFYCADGHTWDSNEWSRLTVQVLVDSGIQFSQ